MLVAYSMYLIGLAVAILIAAVIHLIDRKKSENYLLIELPEYKAPSSRTVAIYVWEKVKDGTYPMFSIEGEAERVEVERENTL